MKSEICIGEHRLRLESHDMCCVAYVGAISEEEVRRLCAEMHDFAAGKRSLFVLMDLSRTGPVPAASRKALAEAPAGLPVRGAAAFGATFAVRVLATLIGKSAELLKLRTAEQLVRFFATEAEARAWLEEHRSRTLQGDRSVDK